MVDVNMTEKFSASINLADENNDFLKQRYFDDCSNLISSSIALQFNTLLKWLLGGALVIPRSRLR